ncbi:unnamed protein product [Symbiodinium sp. CCMP2592]|nr:unnamed protein product [Symbiodinium sp. CCMP2592]
MASADADATFLNMVYPVVVLTVKVSKRRRPPRPSRLAKDQESHVGKLAETKLELKEDMKREVKEEASKKVKTEIKEESSKDIKSEVKEEMTQKDIKQEAKEKGSKDADMEVKEESNEDQESHVGKLAETKLELKEDMKREVKEEASKKVKTEIKEESSKDIKSEVKEELTQKDIKQEAKEKGSKDADMEVKEESNEVVSSRRRKRTKDKKSQSESTDIKQEKVDEEQALQVKLEDCEQPNPKRRRLSQKSPDVSVPSFGSRLTEWAEKCLAFQASGKTWLPTKPCCPASPFLGLAAAPWQGCVRDKTTACVQLLSKEQFRELRAFYHENPHHTLFYDNSDPHSERQPATPAVSKAQADRREGGNQHRAAECMKMWPWMRDLPTRAWAGNGWLLVEDGMMKLSPTGGGSTMQGLEIFESVGSVPDPGEPKLAEPRAEQGQIVTRSFRGLERQSGIQGIYWDKEKAGWRVSWQVSGKRKRLHFPISKHMKLGLSEAQAEQAALEEAKAFREELVRQGKLRPPREKACGSTVRGVIYRKKFGCYKVEITDPSTAALSR